MEPCIHRHIIQCAVYRLIVCESTWSGKDEPMKKRRIISPFFFLFLLFCFTVLQYLRKPINPGVGCNKSSFVVPNASRKNLVDICVAGRELSKYEISDYARRRIGWVDGELKNDEIPSSSKMYTSVFYTHIYNICTWVKITRAHPVGFPKWLQFTAAIYKL